MRPEYYSDVYRRYSTYMRNQPGSTLYRIASGASDYDYNWNTVLMVAWALRTHGRPLPTLLYSRGLEQQRHIDRLRRRQVLQHPRQSTRNRHRDTPPHRHYGRKDPKAHVGLMVDEWGTWYDEEPGTTPDTSSSRTPCATPWWPHRPSTYSTATANACAWPT